MSPLASSVRAASRSSPLLSKTQPAIVRVFLRSSVRSPVEIFTSIEVVPCRVAIVQADEMTSGCSFGTS